MRKFSRRIALASPTVLAFSLQADRRESPPERRRLQSKWSPERLASALLPQNEWRHFPPATDRNAWNKVAAPLRARCLKEAEAVFGQPWPVLPASLYLDYKRTGTRARFERQNRERRQRLKDLVIAECLENEGRFLDDIANGVWAICEESTWCWPAHIATQKAGVDLPDTSEPIVDLFAADTGSLISWTWFLLNPSLDKVSPLVRQRMKREVETRILAPFRQREDFWWMGLDGQRDRMNNWNPWINSNCLTCALLLSTEPERSQLVYKVMRSVDRFLDSYNDDGGCDEGPGYWNHAGGSLFENLELLYSASGGKVDFYSIPLVAEIGRYIYRAHIDQDWYTNFADASAKAAVQGDLIYRYGVRIKDEAMKSHGAYVVSLDEKPLDSASGSIDRQISAIFGWDRLQSTPPHAPYTRDVFLPQTHFFAARLKAGSPKGFYVAAQGGHNAESHNHNDVGNFIVSLDGQPVLIDIGVETYTAKTFSSRRYEIWTMQSSWHNCPTVDGEMQSAGRKFEANAVTAVASDSKASFSLNLEKAYPDSAGIRSWKRTVSLERTTDTVLLEDQWKLERPSLLEFSFITNHQVSASSGSVVIGKVARLRHDPAFEAVIDMQNVEDARLQPVWGKLITRVRLTRKGAPATGQASFRIERL